MIIFKCMFMIFKQSKTLINIKEINQSKLKQNRVKKCIQIWKLGKTEAKHVDKTKEKQTEGELGFLGKSMCMHT